MANKLLGELSAGEFRDVRIPSTQETAPLPEENVSEQSFNASEVIELARNSLDFLAAMCMPLIFSFCFPPVFISVWIWLLSYVHKVRDFSQLALGLPRGFGKTTVIKLFALYCILFTQKKFILIISHSAGLAENIVADIIDMLEEPNIKKVFGDWKLGIEKDTLGLKKFGFRGRNIILAGIGAGTSLRGLNIKNTRPDVMIFEDIQSREQAESEVLSANLEKWMVGTAMKAKSPTGCMYIFVGNMYPTKHSILRKLKHNPTWTKFIAGGILADNTSLWEELQPIEQLLKEFQNDLSMGRPEIFYAEVLNDENAASNNLIDLSALPTYPVQQYDVPNGNFIIIDPSNDKVNSDAVSIGLVNMYGDKPVLQHIREGRFSPSDTIREALTLALEHNCRLIAVESNAFQYSLLHWFDFICAQLQITGIHIVDIYSGKSSKNSRIVKMFSSLKAGEIFIAPECAAPVNLQITEFNPLRADNTDGLLDLLTYIPKVISEYSQYIASLDIINMQETDGIKVVEYNSCF